MQLKQHKKQLLFSSRVWIVLALFFMTLGMRAAANQGENKERWRIEVFGGYDLASPADLNQLAGYENSMQTFLYDDRLDYMKKTGDLTGWSKTNDTQQKQIKSAMPLGGRVSYFLSPRLAISLGCQYLSRAAASSFDVTYTWDLSQYDSEVEKMAYAPFSISATAFSPTLGIQWQLPLNKKMGIGIFLNGGPLFASCHYNSNWSYNWTYKEVYQGQTYSSLLFTDSRDLKMDGSGTGLAVEMGARLDYALSSRFGIFASVSYDYQHVKKISGSGSEVLPNSSAQWDGTWALKKETIKTLWGTLEIEVPNNYWPAGKDWVKTRDFELDLSAFQARLGIFMRL
jgi:hypothetical protein